jgi:tRNA pseudouridine55 synthase
VDKPRGPTSHDAVARVRRVFRTRAVGHTGTLDPFATGLLVILLGKATRLARFVEQQAKTYLATAHLGVRTSTDDLTGEVLDGPADGRTGGPSRLEVEAALAGFLGPQRQRPPAFSAKRVDGERSYAKARRGEAVELAEVETVVHAIELVGYRYPELEFRATVSAGTYVRALARDLGERLGVGAHLTSLRREAIGQLRVEQAVPLDQIGPESLLPPLAVLGHLPRIEVTEEEARALGYGQAVRRSGGQWSLFRQGNARDPRSLEGKPVPLSACSPDPIAAVAPGDRLVAVGRVREDAFQPDVVLEAAG